LRQSLKFKTTTSPVPKYKHHNIQIT